MKTKNANLQISVEQIIDLIIQLPRSEQDRIVKQITKQKVNVYTEFLEKIKGFKSLEKNWDSYNANKISNNAIEKAISVLEKVIQTTQEYFINTHVFPMRNGGIQFELDNTDCDLSIEIEIDTNGILKLIRFDEEGEIEEEIENFRIENLKDILNTKVVIINKK